MPVGDPSRSPLTHLAVGQDRGSVLGEELAEQQL